MKHKALFLVASIFSTLSFAQSDSLVNRLEEVVVTADTKLQVHSVGYKVERLTDSVILKNTESFTNLLRFNTPIYLREYGSGGTSSASFRGTSSSNTAVIWNGININSVNSGQTGFNSLTVTLFDGINVRSGGGSIEYGSGAIGGTIHLNDNLKFTQNKRFKNHTLFSVGSYNTYQGLHKLKFSNKKIVISAGASYNSSNNDYPWLNTDYKNTNGAYSNLALNFSGSFYLNKQSQLNFYTANYRGERFFSGELPNPTTANDKYQDFSNRNLLVYTNKGVAFNHEAKLAYLTQEYRYFADKNSSNFNFGKSKRMLVNYNLKYSFNKIRASITSFSEFENIYGSTDQISEQNRRQFSQSVVYNQNLQQKIAFEAKIRKDFNTDYSVPFTYALGINYKVHSSWFLRVNGSKNYRVPTYNDLYWPGQGNLDLIPEIAAQGELGLGFKNNKFSADLGVFYIATKDKIVWTPNGDEDRPGVWVPINLSEVNNKGAELALSYNGTFHNHKLQFNLNYSYTEAIDASTNKQTIYTPKHLLNFNLSYNYKRFLGFYQQLYNGKVYTTASNSEDFIVPDYAIANAGINFKILHTNANTLQLGVKVNNLFNKYYVIQPRRPMPNRNFNINVNYTF
ncbi:TonB-dependent receptor plug domain-containing protein [Neotamlana laminarinivorans]|uniref:TonB-dependent receptor n=1 Tax=Neotamlana laminarinivorans TaxID=2883124 RepID=A0A9X1L1K3_9FLAO|nr:TonB-dependent receptor [Tamlana laminarinivorans]MCB4798765.1 TonB-dependent receptor [Tamlana laminarinivorans]